MSFIVTYFDFQLVSVVFMFLYVNFLHSYVFLIAILGTTGLMTPMGMSTPMPCPIPHVNYYMGGYVMKGIHFHDPSILLIIFLLLESSL